MKIYVKAMSTPRSKALQKASFYADDLIEHVIKIVVYYEIRQQDVSHWIGEIANWIQGVDGIKLKPNNGKLSEQDIGDTLFSWMGDDIDDYKYVLNMFRHKNKKGGFNYEDKGSYPDFEVTYDLAEEVYGVCLLLVKNTIDMICAKQDHTLNEYKKVLNDTFAKYL